MDEKTDRERILALELEVRGMRDLLAEQRSADKTTGDLAYKQLLAQLTTLATAADKFALATTVEKNESRLTALERQVTEIANVVVPRSEVQVRLEGVAARQETMSVGLQRLSQSLDRLSDEWGQEESDRQVATANKDRKRTFLVAVIGVTIAALVSIPGFVSLFRHTGQVVVYPPVTTTVPGPATAGR